MTAGVFCRSARYRLHRADAAVPTYHVRKQWSNLSVARYLSVFITPMPSLRSWKNKRACGPTIHTYIRTYVRTYVHTYTYIYIYIYYPSIHPSIHPPIHACMHTYIHTYIHPYIHTHIHTYIHTYIDTCIPATERAERLRKICGCGIKSADHYFGQRTESAEVW